MDKREYLRSLGFTVGDRGRFSAEMQTSLASAPEGSYTEPEPKPVKAKSVKVVTGTPSSEVKVAAPKSTADPKAVRQWAKDNGVEVGDRGRIKPEVFSAYTAAKVEGGEKPVERITPATYTGPTAPALHSADTKWQHIDAKGKKWTVGIATACSKTGVSLGWCPEDEHNVVVGDVRLGLVPVRKV